MSAWVVFANIGNPHRTKLRVGAKVAIVGLNGGNISERLPVSGMSIGGRRITVWVRGIELIRPRAGYLHDQPASRGYTPLMFDTKDQAERCADHLRGCIEELKREAAELAERRARRPATIGAP